MAIAVATESACIVQPARGVIEDVRRAREFYRYLQPDNLLLPHVRRRSSTFDRNHDHTPSLSHALAPFCQLVALRCNAYKAMLNVMDRDVMYFLAEASLRKDKAQTEEGHDFVEDPIFLSCSSVPLKGRICELTLKADKPEGSSQVPTFVIPDLSKSQFAEMSIVAGPPFYRFYAGVPITTRSGVNIGSIAIMDTVVRANGLTRMEEDFLGKSAEQVMSHLEINRQAIEGRRSRQMAKGLEAFISGKKSINEDGANVLSEKSLKKRAKAAYGISLESDNDYVLDQDHSPKAHHHLRMDPRSDSVISLESDKSSSAHSTEDEEQQTQNVENDSRSHSRIFARAANLLRESLGDLGEEGSVHFLSLATRLGANNSQSRSATNKSVNLSRVESLTDFTNGEKGGLKQQKKTLQCHVIASSTTSEPLLSEQDEPSCQLLELDDEFLRGLMRRYPGGRLWTLDESASSSEDDAQGATNGNKQRTDNEPRRSSRRKRSEVVALRASFPSARQVLFVPVWDAIVGSFAYGCFITSTLETRSFVATTELPFLSSFCSTVMAECSRLDAMIADRQKSDFVGTISHEMRSPLHGVLASVEFLADTNVTGFQKSLIETIDSCGRTLLDTINHVLDFSKINSFQKQWQAGNKRGTNTARRNNFLGPEKAVSTGAPPLLQLFGATDVSAVLEEVVDGLVLGQTYNSGIDITDTSREARGRVSSTRSDSARSVIRSNAVKIILNIKHGDWTFMTQPGAVRRIIMNVTGNAIKYTAQGTIKVSLQQRDAPEDAATTRIMVLTVTDTGKGISPEFLESRLFVPFAQENALAPGTGLGMSIVRSIVLMLGGTIDVKSRVGKGTSVEVSIPMRRPLPGQVSTQNTPHSGGTIGSANSSGDESIQLLQNQATGETVTLYRPQPRIDDALEKAVQHYVRDWYGLEYVEQELIEGASVVIVEEEDLESLMARVVGTPEKRPSLVVMCSVSSRHSTSLITSLERRLSSPVEFVARPCGPNKLARSIREALEKRQAIKMRIPRVAALRAIPESMTPNGALNSSPACDPAGHELQQLDLSYPGELGHVVQASETFAASQFSHNAQMAIRDPSAGLRTPRTQMANCDAFPFPKQSEERPKESHGDNSIASTPSTALFTDLISPSTKIAVVEPNQTASETVTQVDPHLLLVDDNKINLKLLETFLKRKRNYMRIEQAEDGQQAVNAFVAAKESFDIIFMDISMPVMNGFEATRAIRAHEEQCGVANGAMVIALTGLASGRDQSEGFDSGCDIYMTKPVSFKEVGKLLDNWEGHRRINMEESINQEMTRLNIQSVMI